jgi:Glyoxalase-like domain
MLLGIDHLVIAVRDPDAAGATIVHDLGIAFTGGGRHDAWGTFNRLAFLGDSYLELIGVFDRALVASETGSAVGRATLVVLDAGREGLVTFALATDDIDGDVGRLRATGSSIAAPVDGSRTRPDGDVVRWRTAAAGRLGPCDPPFLIEHDDAGAEWDLAARAGRKAFEHPGGGRVRLARIEIPCADPSAAASAYRATVGLAFGSSDDGGAEARVGSQVMRLSGDRGNEPVVALVGAWPVPIDLVRFGIRWRCARYVR